MTQQATQQNPEKPKPICYHCKKPSHYRNQCRQHDREKDQAQDNRNNAGNNNNNNNGGQTNSNFNNKIFNNATQSIQTIKKTENRNSPTQPVRPAVKLTIPQRNVTLEQTQLMDPPPPETDGRKDKIRSNKEVPKIIQMQTFKLQPNL